ncbi:MAG: DHA2 family efflux MFS transporter permease subunit [Anaerolineales bacterium]|nr:DHA2 family efflux MFS transporter permease subunit [Anaerolineales bacterium]
MNQLKVIEKNYKWWGLAAMLFGTFTVVLSLSFLFPATPVIMQDFAVPIETVAWLSLAYALGASVFEPMWGRLGDLHGRKRNALTGLALFTAGAFICAITPNIWAMAGARFIQGLGAAAIIPIGMAFVGENFPLNERGRAIGWWGMVSGAAPALGPTLGGYLIDWFGWRAIYWASLVLGLLGIGVIGLIVKESRRARAEPFDLPGSILLALSAGSLLLAVNQGRAWGWTSPLTMGFAGSFILLLVFFILVENHTAHPVVDLSIVRTRLFASAGLVVFVSFLVFQGAFFLIPFFLQQVQGYPASQTGQLVMPLFLGIMGASLLSGRLSDRIGVRLPALLGTLLTALALYLLSLVQRETTYLSLLAIMAVLGVGIGATLPPLSRAITGGVPLRQIGAATGIFNMVRNLGGPFGIAIAATIFAQRAAEVGKTYVANRLIALGIEPSVISDLSRLKELAQSGASLTPLQQRTLGLLRQLGPQIQAIQDEARLQALQLAFVEVAWVLLAVSAIGILATLIVDTRRRKLTWMPDALALLERFPRQFRARAYTGFEKVAGQQQLRMITPEFVIEVGRDWKAREA